MLYVLVFDNGELGGFLHLVQLIIVGSTVDVAGTLLLRSLRGRPFGCLIVHVLGRQTRITVVKNHKS